MIRGSPARGPSIQICGATAFWHFALDTMSGSAARPTTRNTADQGTEPGTRPLANRPSSWHEHPELVRAALVEEVRRQRSGNRNDHDRPDQGRLHRVLHRPGVDDVRRVRV